MKLIPCILLVAIVATTQAELKVTLIDGNWNPGEVCAVTTRPNPLHRPFGVDFDSKCRMWIVELEGGRVHRLAKRRLTECITSPLARMIPCTFPIAGIIAFE